MIAPANIFIVGASSTGKTTLINALETHFAHPASTSQGCPRPRIITEQARLIIPRLLITRDDLGTNMEPTLRAHAAILQAQYLAEGGHIAEPAKFSGGVTLQNEAKKEGGWFISDRSGLDPLLYTQLFVSKAAALQMVDGNLRAWVTVKRSMQDGLVFLCEAGGEWLKDDGVRSMPHNDEDWTRFDEVFREWAKGQDIAFETIGKGVLDLKERVSIVLRAIHARNGARHLADSAMPMAIEDKRTMTKLARGAQ